VKGAALVVRFVVSGWLLLAVGATSSVTALEIGAGVGERIAAAGRARVVILFAPAASGASDAPGGPDARAQSESAAFSFRARVLARLTPADFEPLPLPPWRHVPAAPGWLSASGLARLASEPGVLRVDLDLPGRGNLAESVPLVHADVVQSLGLTGKSITVAILDSGVTVSHPDLADDVVAQRCFCVNANGSGCCPNGQTSQSGAGAAADEHGHGTNVSGIVTSAGRIAPTGVAPGAPIVVVRVLDRNNSFSGTAQIVSALDWIASERPDVRVLNMSLGTFALFSVPCDGASAAVGALARAIDLLRGRGVLVTVSTGNDRSTVSMEAPACSASATSVSATYDANFGLFDFFGCSEPTAADKVACFGNSAPGLKLLAPGAAITSAGIDGGRSTFFGTSQAAPHVAAAAALLLQARPSLSPSAIESVLASTGVPIADPRNGLVVPRIDVAAAARSLGVGAPSVCNPDSTTLCLNAGRFRVQTSWRAPGLPGAGTGNAVAETADTGHFWFFSPNNVELVVKVVDGRPVNNHFWFFSGALTDVEYSIVVTDTATGAVRTYFNPSQSLESLADAAAFSGP
jgi:subtilisin family serine protease